VETGSSTDGRKEAAPLPLEAERHELEAALPLRPRVPGIRAHASDDADRCAEVAFDADARTNGDLHDRDESHPVQGQIFGDTDLAPAARGGKPERHRHVPRDPFDGPPGV